MSDHPHFSVGRKGPEFIRPSDHLAPEEYAEWLQADARHHARRSDTRLRLALAVGLFALAIAIALV